MKLLVGGEWYRGCGCEVVASGSASGDVRQAGFAAMAETLRQPTKTKTTSELRRREGRQRPNPEAETSGQKAA